MIQESVVSSDVVVIIPTITDYDFEGKEFLPKFHVNNSGCSPDILQSHLCFSTKIEHMHVKTLNVKEFK